MGILSMRQPKAKRKERVNIRGMYEALSRCIVGDSYSICYEL